VADAPGEQELIEDAISSLPEEQLACLEGLAKLGIHGSTVKEVAKTLLVERLIEVLGSGLVGNFIRDRELLKDLPEAPDDEATT
jgi:hypothetical protein